MLVTLTMTDVDICTKENDALDVNGDARGVKRPPSSPEVDPVKKLKVIFLVSIISLYHKLDKRLL